MNKRLLIFIISFLLSTSAYSQASNLLAKYGSEKKDAKQLELDQKFIAEVDKQYSGNRIKASYDLSLRAWEYLRQGNLENAMKRFNQSWLLDPKNGTAIWGMAAISANKNDMTQALSLFEEAELLLKDDLNFLVDYARFLGMHAVNTKNQIELDAALKKYSEIYEKDSNHTQNLQNWAIILFYVGRYQEAMQKIELAEKTTNASELDLTFVKALKEKLAK